MASTRDAQRAILAGTTAFGWPYSGTGSLDLDADPMRGYLRCHEDGHIEFEVLDEDPIARDLSFQAPPMFALSTPHGSALLLDVYAEADGALNFGAGRASVLRYRADSMISGIDICEVSGGRLNSAALRFQGFGEWAGMSSVTTQVHRDSDNRVHAAVLELRNSKTEVAKRRLPSSLDLTVQGFWDLSDARRQPITVSTGMDIEVSAVKPRAFSEFLEPLLDCQDLLSLVSGRFVQAEPAPVRGVRGSVAGLLWTRLGMHIPKAAIIHEQRLPSLVPLADLGGVAGMARWSSLRSQHRVVVDTITSPYRNGPDTIETVIVRMGAAIELWVAAHKRNTNWAKAGKSYAEALALHVGKPFEKWVGSSQKWAKEFTTCYNGNKHHTSRVISPDTLRLFASTGRWLLVCALLDRVALSKAPSRAILEAPRMNSTGERMRNLLGAL